MNKILIVNASLRGVSGNSFRIASKAKTLVEENSENLAEVLNLADEKLTFDEIQQKLDSADGFLVVSGTYWSNISSVLQRFAEVFTPYENTELFFGKPFSSVVSMDSVGGTEVVGKINTIFLGLGCWLPPCSSVVVSRLGEWTAAQPHANELTSDVWHLEDLKVPVANLLKACELKRIDWSVWAFRPLSSENTETKLKMMGGFLTDNEVFVG